MERLASQKSWESEQRIMIGSTVTE